jgi:hypothetical protein
MAFLKLFTFSTIIICFIYKAAIKSKIGEEVLYHDKRVCITT